MPYGELCGGSLRTLDACNGVDPLEPGATRPLIYLYGPMGELGEALVFTESIAATDEPSVDPNLLVSDPLPFATWQIIVAALACCCLTVLLLACVSMAWRARKNKRVENVRQHALV
jgi:hypothetical protein